MVTSEDPVAAETGVKELKQPYIQVDHPDEINEFGGKQNWKVASKLHGYVVLKDLSRVIFQKKNYDLIISCIMALTGF